MTSSSRGRTQADISAEIEAISKEYDAAGGRPRPTPRLDYPPYRSSILRHPTKAPQQVDPEGIELWAPVFGQRDVDPLEADLTIQHRGEPIGERMVVTGRVTDGDGRPVRHQLVEIWQANAGGRYIHQRDQHPARDRPQLHRHGPLPHRRRRQLPRSPRSSPGPTRGRTTTTPGGRRTSTSRSSAREFTQRLITQMYFPGDPLFALDPIYQAIVDPAARARLVATYDHDVTTHEWATGYRWDIVLTGIAPHPARRRTRMSLAPTPGQTVGPFFGYALPYDGDSELVPPTRPDAIRLHGRVYDGAGDPVPDALIELWQAAPDGSVPRAPGSLHRDGYTFTGWGRAATDRTGHYQFSTLRPGARRRRGAVLRDHGLRPRAARPALHPGLPAGRRARARWPSLAAACRRPGLRLRHPAAGRGRDRLPVLRARLRP